ncbi:integral membrane protein PTH11 [Fusarium mundagurra]|uniref:Integral membrane protein PTH11 n=1 Tax=Fusarium mundagurra TaxID=1567541 RepID=A0A8H5XQ59_9HYPO|nr:integral membrane protein PTH11 [Fusarium mundagurra]
MGVNANITSVTPEGPGLALLIVALFFASTTTIIIALRCGIRAKHHVFAMDDSLMLIGWMLFIAVVGFVSKGTSYGLGAKDDRLNPYLFEKSAMYIWLYEVFQGSAFIFIKSSICITLLRIAIKKSHKVIVWIALGISCISAIIAIIGVFTICRPIQASWNKSAGTCSPLIVIASLTYLVSAAGVVTDWICAILPGFMLYKTQMRRASKVSICIILGLGALASVATIVRLPYIYIKYHTYPTDYFYHAGNSTIWSVFESGTGIIAGSLPSLRRLLKKWVHFDSSHRKSSAPITPFTGPGVLTVTNKAAASSIGRRHIGLMPTSKSEREWEQLDDASSSRQIYMRDDIEMLSLEQLPTSSRSRESIGEI